jgi:hypothetical protein
LLNTKQHQARFGARILDKLKGMIYVARYSSVLPDNSQIADGLFRVGRGLVNMRVEPNYETL